MTIANRLRGAFALYVVSLVALAMSHARAIQRAADDSRALTEMAERVRVSTDELSRIDQMSADAEKYLATRDRRYRDRFAAAYADFGVFSDLALRPPVLDSLRERVQAEGTAAQDAMRRQLVQSEQAAQRTARAAWLAAAVALVLSVVLSMIVVRSIVRPLDHLARGTRAVSDGRFDYRLDENGDDEFARLARDFNSMTERLAELDRMKKDFVAKVSHDLKTPLSSMQETISALLDQLAGPLSSKQRELLEMNLESGQRLSAMLGKLLDLSRIEAGMAPVFEDVDVSRIAKRAVHESNVKAAHNGVRLALAGSELPAFIRGDAAGMSQVLDNLVENAIKFSPIDGEVIVSVEQPSESEVALTVADEGPGIPSSERDKVFERFYQTDAGRAARGRGVGLGLTICREIVAAHGGRIWVDENKPRGSVFHVLLQRSTAAVAVIVMVGAIGCATAHTAPPVTRPQDLELRIAALTTELAAAYARLDSTTAQADSLRLELQRLKEIDLKPRTRRPPSVR